MIRNSLSILVVDDMKFSCAFIRRALSNEGYTEIEVVNNAPDALKLLEERSIDVVLADWFMPEMNGLELAQKIRQLDREQHQYTGIVLLTTKDDITSISTAFEEGVDDYIIKPPNQIELAARVYAAGRVTHMQNDLLKTTQTLQQLFEDKCTVDPVTNLGRLENTEQHLDALLKQTHSRGGATSCAILQISDLGELKSQHGTKVEEEILSSVANRIRRMVRPGDLIGHTTSGEFVIGMYTSNKDDALSHHFKRILQDLNHRSYKTTHGFLNIHCAMAMTISHKDNLYTDVKSFISDTHNKLNKSVAMGFEEVAT